MYCSSYSIWLRCAWYSSLFVQSLVWTTISQGESSPTETKNKTGSKEQPHKQHACTLVLPATSLKHTLIRTHNSRGGTAEWFPGTVIKKCFTEPWPQETEGVEEIKVLHVKVGTCNNSLIRSSEEHIQKKKNPRNGMLNSSLALGAVPQWQIPKGVEPYLHIHNMCWNRATH